MPAACNTANICVLMLLESGDGSRARVSGIAVAVDNTMEGRALGREEYMGKRSPLVMKEGLAFPFFKEGYP